MAQNNLRSNAAAGWMTCGVCGSAFDFQKSDARPFCSSKCQMVDLGRWFNENISVPHEGGPTKGETTEQGDEDDQYD